MRKRPWLDAPKRPAISAEWADALLAIACRERGRRPDARPLAKLLREGKAPAEALECIAELIDPELKYYDYKLVPRVTKFKTEETEKQKTMNHKRYVIALHMRKRIAAGKMTVEESAEEVGELSAVRKLHGKKLSGRSVIKLWGEVAKRDPKFWLKANKRSS